MHTIIYIYILLYKYMDRNIITDCKKENKKEKN